MSRLIQPKFPTLVRCVWKIALVALLGLILLAGSPEPVGPATASIMPAMTFTVTNTGDSGAGSLRQAIMDANVNAGLDTINFSLGAGPYTITPLTTLPTITDAVMIDGATGNASSPRVTIDGVSAGTSAYGLVVTSGGSMIQNLIISRFNLAGIRLLTGGGNTIRGCFIGTDSTGATAQANGDVGVSIENSANNFIGGTSAGQGNLISGNSSGGIGIFFGPSTGNHVEGNIIGLNATGTSGIPNGSVGILISDASSNVIGGTMSGARNVISRNTGTGISCNSGSSDNRIEGNFIGTDITGTVDLGNSNGGVFAAGTTNVVGGTAAGAGNIISGNSNDGVQVAGTGIRVEGNFIGTDVSGSTKIANDGSGVYLRSVNSNNVVGGAATGARNVISGNGLAGVTLDGGSAGAVTSNRVEGNYIGTDISGNNNLGNTLDGVLVFLVNGNAIGGTAMGAGNRIAFNGRTGVLVLNRGGSTGTGNKILGNEIFSNAALGIDLTNDTNFTGNPNGVTADDGCDGDTGANGLQNFPVLTSVTTGGGNTIIVGALNSLASTNFRIEFFASDSCDASGNGEGKTFLGATTVSTDSGCNAAINITTAVTVGAGSVITSTATRLDAQGNAIETSEFSQCITVPVTCSITCAPNQTVNTGPGSTQCGATVQYPAPTTGGSCGTVTCAPSSGSFFAKGTTAVNCTTSSGPSCSFNVTVVDNTPPVVTCPPNTTAGTSGSCAVVNYAVPTVSDSCPGATVNCSPPSGACFAPGTTTVTCAATDTSNNQSSCSFTVTVTQTTCTVSCPLNQMANTGPASNQCGTVVNYAAPTTGGQCGTVICNPPSGSFFAVGTTTVTCTAAAGSSCQFTVTVVDKTKPTITCPANFSAAASGSCAAVSYPTPPVSDNCSASAICSPPSGTCFPVGTTMVSCTASDAGGNTTACSFTMSVLAFDVCLQDDSDGSIVLLFNSITGDYVFCCGTRALNGRGVIRKKGETLVLEHNAPDRRVLGSTDRSVHQGKASLQSPAGAIICTIADRDTTNNTCVCSSRSNLAHDQPQPSIIRLRRPRRAQPDAR